MPPQTSDAFVQFLLTFLVWWVVFWCAYAALLFGLDWLIAVWRRQQRRRQQRQAYQVELERIDRQTAVAVHRIGAAFTVAQQLLREHPHER